MTAVHIMDDGGYPLTLVTPTIPLATALRVKVDTAAQEHECYSGVAGQGSDVFADDATHITFVVPPLPPGGPYDVRVYNGASLIATVAGAIVVDPRWFRSKTFDIRSLYDPKAATGPQAIPDEPAQPRVPSFGAIAGQNVVQGAAITPVVVTLTNPDDTFVTFDTLNLPAGLVIQKDSNTQATILGTATDVESDTVTVRALFRVDGFVASSSFAFVVAAAVFLEEFETADGW